MNFVIKLMSNNVSYFCQILRVCKPVPCEEVCLKNPILCPGRELKYVLTSNGLSLLMKKHPLSNKIKIRTSLHCMDSFSRHEE